MKRVLACLAVVVMFPGCGYRDDNPEAARVVAQALLDAYRAGDANQVCQLLGPALFAATAAQGEGNCQPFVQRTFDASLPPLQAGRVVADNDTSMRVSIAGRPHEVLAVVKYASVWRVEQASLLTPR